MLLQLVSEVRFELLDFEVLLDSDVINALPDERYGPRCILFTISLFHQVDAPFDFPDLVDIQ